MGTSAAHVTTMFTSGRGPGSVVAGARPVEQTDEDHDFEIPEIYAPFTDTVNPHAPFVKTIAERWIEEAGLTPTPGARDRMRRTDPYGAAAYTWPHANFPELILMTKWLTTVFRLDDQLDEGPTGSHPGQCAAVIFGLYQVLDGHHPRSPSPILNAFAELWDQTRHLLPQPWTATLTANIKRWLSTYQEESLLRAAGIMPDLATYLQRREYSVGMPWLYDLATLSLHPLLPATTLTSPSMRTLRRAASLHSGLVNDLHSATREALTGYPCNAVLIIENTTGTTRQRAADTVNDLITTLAHEMTAAQHTLTTELDHAHTPPPARAAVLLHAERITACTRGQITWHATSPRYATDDFTSGTTGYPEDL
ncbi:terpene synthase family protein [Streptomyces sp. NBC_00388]|uniref:terpene synthase family protein n=1 Tax=Streptomyces sp. NBC_00388 TaxID=2975735 RepID=UPI002E1C0801